ncbi:four-carbon acid sugar kinase family protein [Brevibacterium sp. RIT 803]|uniref:four-carbon acid sugar kinase family protein n=1 Tax=Brevibacterium sp. RIT 803 TaxID=2810210 RepID=UPI00194DD71A|nr:four-carbon acid sugar kinase family protein [Brevibacterium sp. RIT 803]MBM6590326.1 four-carbon acid sugar kinase family protein [Brevibacterium sp. RIT 803]
MSQRSPRILIVADDLTGGNACGALFAEAGLRTITVTGTSRSETVNLDDLLDDYDAVVLNADSRHLPPEKAAELTESLIDITSDIDLVACRIDTTLRGNVGPSAEAALNARRRAAESAGGRKKRVMGLCVPAFPTAGRTTIQGRQLLEGRLLEHTELKHDVRSPMHTSDVDAILRTGTDLDAHLIEISTVLSGHWAIRSEVLDAISDGTDIIIADALTEDHVRLVGSVVASVTREIAEDSTGADSFGARARAGLRNGEVLDWVTIDPGPGSLALALSLLPTRPGGAILGISGSATEVTRAQLAKLAEDPTIALIRTILDEENLPDVEATLERVEEVTSARAIIIATVLESGDLLDLSNEQSEMTTKRLAMIAAAVMSSPVITGLYTTGGDVTAMVMRAVGAVGMEIEKEIVPLAVGGRLVGGSADGLPIVTKGGLIGDSGTAVKCLDYLMATSRVGQG